MSTTNDALRIMVTTYVSRDLLEDTLCDALEGGSNYWYCIEKASAPADKPAYLHEYPLRGGSLWFSAKGDDGDDVEIEGSKRWVLDEFTMRKGAETMARMWPRHWGNLITENGDAETADVFLQCALFGDIIFG